jgi:hypothetical protein
MKKWLEGTAVCWGHGEDSKTIVSKLCSHEWRSKDDVDIDVVGGKNTTHF